MPKKRKISDTTKCRITIVGAILLVLIIGIIIGMNFKPLERWGRDEYGYYENNIMIWRVVILAYGCMVLGGIITYFWREWKA